MIFSKQENTKTIGIYTNLNVTVFVHCNTDTLVNHSLDTLQDGHWFLYCLTKKGCVYSVEKGCEEQFIGQSSTTENQQSEIFSDLLGHDGNDDMLQLHMSTKPVYILNDSDIILNSNEISIALCVSSNHIIIATEHSVQYTLYMYGKQCTKTDEESLAILPKSLHSFEKDIFSSPVILQIITCDCIDSSDISCSDVLKIDVTLFKQLFGEEVALLNSPILLLSQKDGAVYFIPLSSFTTSSRNSILSPTKSTRQRWGVLCHMSDSVVGICGLTLQIDDRPGENCNALCICGSDGQVVIFLSNCGKPEYTISEVCIYSPVLSVKSFHNKLYYSTGRSTVESMIEIQDTGNKHLVIDRQLQISDTKLLSCHNVTCIHSISSDGYAKSQASPCTLYCSCQDGQVKELNTSSWSYNTCTAPSTQHDNLKDILTSIDDVGKKRQHVKNEIKIQEEKMKQLGIASYLNQYYLNQIGDRMCNNLNIKQLEGGKKYTELPFSVVLLPVQAVDVDSEVFEMTVEILNQMSVALSADWTVNVSVISINNADEIITASVKINKEFKGNEKVIIPVHIALEQVLSTCKLIVKAVLGTENNGEQNIDNRENCCKETICVPIYEKEIDIVDFMMPASENNQINGGVLDCSSATYVMVRDQARNRMERLKYTRSNEDIDDNTVCARNVVHLSKPAIGKDGHDKVAQKLLEALFGNAISNNSGIKPSNFQLVTALGHVVQLSILPLRYDEEDCVADEETWSRNMGACEVIIRSRSYIAAAVHRAISHREQQILQTIENESTKSPTVSIHLCRKAIKIAEDTMNDVSGNHQNEAILPSAFQKMRSVKLL